MVTASTNIIKYPGPVGRDHGERGMMVGAAHRCLIECVGFPSFRSETRHLWIHGLGDMLLFRIPPSTTGSPLGVRLRTRGRELSLRFGTTDALAIHGFRLIDCSSVSFAVGS